MLISCSTPGKQVTREGIGGSHIFKALGKISVKFLHLSLVMTSLMFLAHLQPSHSSVGKGSACSAGDLGLIPGLGRSPGEGNCNPLQYSWTSLVAQTVKRLSTIRETRVQSLGWEHPREKEMAIHSKTIAWKIPWTEEPHNYTRAYISLSLSIPLIILLVMSLN